MEIGSLLKNFEFPENSLQKELKPLKGSNFDLNVQRFEQIMFNGQSFEAKGVNSTENINAPNAISNLGEAFFDKIGNFKKSIDLRMHEVGQLLNRKDQLDIKDLLNVQWQVSLFSVETTLVSKSGEKVSEGIQTLFRNQ